eukprot:1140736-Pelagomonas_calceolata.AAC.4
MQSSLLQVNLSSSQALRHTPEVNLICRAHSKSLLKLTLQVELAWDAELAPQVKPGDGVKAAVEATLDLGL